MPVLCHQNLLLSRYLSAIRIGTCLLIVSRDEHVVTLLRLWHSVEADLGPSLRCQGITKCQEIPSEFVAGTIP